MRRASADLTLHLPEKLTLNLRKGHSMDDCPVRSGVMRGSGLHVSLKETLAESSSSTAREAQPGVRNAPDKTKEPS